MIKNKKIFLATFLFVSLLEAKSLLNGISVLVNNEPITLYEIHMVSKQNNVDLKEALRILIQKSLENSQVKKLGIEASDFEVEKKIEEIASKSGVSKEDLIEFARKKGLSERDYREKISQGIKTQKLYERILKSKNALPNEQEVKAYYKANKSRLGGSNLFKVIVYQSKSQKALSQVVYSPMSVVPGVVAKSVEINSKQVDEKTLYYLNQTPKGKFTPIIKTKNAFITFLVEDKSSNSSVSLQEAEPMIKNILANRKQQIAVRNYFEKLKARADIEILRQP